MATVVSASASCHEQSVGECEPQCSRCEPQRAHAPGLVARAPTQVSTGTTRENVRLETSAPPTRLATRPQAAHTGTRGRGTHQGPRHSPGAAAQYVLRHPYTQTRHSTSDDPTHVPHHTSAATHRSTTHGAAPRALHPHRTHGRHTSTLASQTRLFRSGRSSAESRMIRCPYAWRALSHHAGG